MYQALWNKYQTNYELAKGVWYLFYGSVIAFDYLINEQSRYVASCTVCLGILEGMLLLLKRISILFFAIFYIGICSTYGISVNDVANGISLGHLRMHNKTHFSEFHKKVNER